MKRTITLIMILAVLMLSISAMADGINFPVEGNPTLKVAYVNREEVTPYPELEYYKRAAEATGINIDWVEWNNTNKDDKIQLAFASGNMPDVILSLNGFISTGNMTDYANQGLIIAWDDYMEYAPNLSAIFEMRPDLSAALRLEDGKLYCMPTISEDATTSNSAFVVCMDWLEKAGVAVPTTLDEFAECLRAVKEVDYNGNGVADEIPWCFTMKASHLCGLDNFMAAFGVGVCNSSKWYLDENHQVGFRYASEAYREGYKFIHELYEEGLVDIEFATMSQAAFEAKLTDPNVTVCFTQYWAEDNVNAGHDTKIYTAIEPLIGPDGEKHWTRNIKSASCGAVITKACENPELAVAWLDYFASEEQTLEAKNGLIGGWLNKAEDGMYYKTMKEDGTFATSNDLGSECPVWAFTPYISEYDNKIVLDSMDNKTYCCSIYDEYLPNAADCWPTTVILTSEENEAVSLVLNDLYDYGDRMQVEFITNGDIDEKWDEFINTLNDMGLETVLEIYQNAYDRAH